MANNTHRISSLNAQVFLIKIFAILIHLEYITDMRTLLADGLYGHLEAGHVYRREMLLPYSKALDRELRAQEQSGILERIGAGLYYCPQKSRFGILPPDDNTMVSAFLKGDPYLLFSWNNYNSLGLGLSQLYNKMIVYNRKRHELITLGGKIFDFRRPTKGFPLTLTKEFLLIDLMNNLDALAEEPNRIKNNLKVKIANFDCEKLVNLLRQYGKVGTRKFLEGLMRE